MFKKRLLVAVSLILSLAVSGCAVAPEPIDHQAQACSATNDILDSWTSVPAADDFSDIEASNAILAATLAVWKSAGGDTDPTFKLLSKYAGKLLLFLAEGSPSSAQGLIDFEEKSGSDLLDKCGIYSVEYVNPLKIGGGFCWDVPNRNAELQEKRAGDWTKVRNTTRLTKIPGCPDSSPWSVDFNVPRGFSSITNASTWNTEYRVAWTYPDGLRFDDGSSITYSCAKASIEVDYIGTDPSYCD